MTVNIPWDNNKKNEANIMILMVTLSLYLVEDFLGLLNLQYKGKVSIKKNYIIDFSIQWKIVYTVQQKQKLAIYNICNHAK